MSWIGSAMVSRLCGRGILQFRTRRGAERHSATAFALHDLLPGRQNKETITPEASCCFSRLIIVAWLIRPEVINYRSLCIEEV